MIEAMARGATIRRFRPGERERLRLAGLLRCRKNDFTYGPMAEEILRFHRDSSQAVKDEEKGGRE